jgi:glucans biosynthesis protein C
VEQTARNHALDWLRVGGTGAVLLFHSARFFDAGDWHVKNPTIDPNLDIFATILIQWLMPLFFILSGAGAWMALQRQSAGRFAAAKVTRLFVPLLFGVLVLAPPQVYLERLTHSQFAGSFLSWLPQYFDGMYAFGGNFAWMGLHLWYLLVLFVWSMVTLPLCLALKNGAAQRAAAFLARPGMAFLLVLPVLALELALNPGSLLAIKSMGGWSPLVYVIFYMFGFLLPADERLPRALVLLWPVAAALSVIIPVVILATDTDINNLPYPSAQFALITGLRDLNAVSWLFAIIGLGYRYLSFNNRFLEGANEATLPFYMLHQTVLIILGYFVVQWQWPNLVKYAFIAPTAAVVILAIYFLLIKPFRVTRYLFGMKPFKSRASRRPAA